MPGRVDGEPPPPLPSLRADTTMATSTARDDTIVLDASPATGSPRVKRVKTEHALPSPSSSLGPPRNASWPTAAPPQPATAAAAGAGALPRLAPALPLAPRSLSQEGSSSSSSSSSAAAAGSPLLAPAPAPATVPAPPPAPAPAPAPVSEGPVLRKIKTPSLRLRLAQESHRESQSPRWSPAPRARLIDLAASPSDPADFVWWFVQQIVTAPPELVLTTPDPLPGFEKMTSIMRPKHNLPPGWYPTEFIREKEREKQRVDNRERKKRWRETNAERSTYLIQPTSSPVGLAQRLTSIDKDNDLRCRVTKLAKMKFGEDDSPEKTAFIEQEFEARRAKRSEKDKRNATFRGTVSAFRTGSSSAKALKDRLRIGLKGHTRPQVEYLGSQLVEFLVDAAGQQLGELAMQTAQMLREGINSGGFAPVDIDEAARYLAGNEELRQALEGGGEEGKDSADPESVGDEEEEGAQENGHWTKDTTPARRSDVLEEASTGAKPVDSTETLNLAVQTLNGMSQPQKPARQPARSTRGRGRGTRGRRGKRQQRTAERASAANHAIDPSSIDALLMLANGGSLTNNDDDDDDDETIPDPDELIAEDLNFFETTADIQLNTILERVATRIVTERLEREGYRPRGGSALPFDADVFRTHAVREQVLRLKTFMSEAGISVNTLMPLAQAQALSELYAHLLKYIERETSLSQETPAKTPMVNGTPSASNPPGGSGKSAILPFDPPVNPHRTSDEQRKIVTYGFPPLPGGAFAGPVGRRI